LFCGGAKTPIIHPLCRSELILFADAGGIILLPIRVGIRELEIEPDNQTKNTQFQEKIRSKGGGRKRLLDIDQTLIPDLEALIQPVMSGHSESPLRWTCESTTKITEKLRTRGHVISARKVASLLYQLGYELQNKRKTKERDSPSDRNIQFQYISDQVENFQARGQLIISLGVNKRKAIKNYNNNAQEWQLKKQFIKYQTDHFSEQELLKVLPDEVYNLTTNQEWVNASINNETVEIAVESIHRWWQDIGKEIYKNATELLITADCSEADESCLELWKTQLQKLANEFGWIIQFAHFPPATSKWNKIEHRMFYLIAENWRGKPLTIKEVVINLITTTTNKEVILENPHDENKNQIDMNVIDKELSKGHLQKSEFHDDWNYRFLPQNSLDFSNS
jgi:hypothetical protein